ncbi:MAG: FAD-dependent thymidylate synthase [Desulfovibrio sp.]|jgi:thymidylate synthase (FAD)|nr:FAD-dependent thymidylate synthase [Desulfovibrio sp.]
MKIIDPCFEILDMADGAEILRRIETAGRVCYKSENRIAPDSAPKFVRELMRSGHHSVIEHAGATVRIVCDRGVTHELVRHRLASYSQESTRYAHYGREKFDKEITVIRPCFWPEGSPEYALWHKAMLAAEQAYLTLTANGASAQQARSVLPNSLKTEIVVTCNLREWRHIFGMRCGPAAHPQIRQIALPLLAQMHKRVPEIFADIFAQFENDISRKIFCNQDNRMNEITH